MSSDLQRQPRSATADPRSVPWPLPGEPDVVAIDTTWGRVQPMEVSPDVRTVGELELIALLGAGARLLDSRSPGSVGGVTIPGATNLPHDEILARRDELNPDQVTVFFCNGPQCPQSPSALTALLASGYPAGALAYYRGGMHDWVSLAMPTEPA